MPSSTAVVITDPTTLMLGASDAATTPAAQITIDTSARTIRITPGAGILPTSEAGVTGQALYSALKLLWKNSSTYIKFPFPMEAITPEQFEFINGWIPFDNITRKALRSCGWVEKTAAGVELKTYAGIVSLGSLGDTDQPYYQQYATTGAPVNFSFQGPVNEGISIRVVAAIPAASVNTTNDTFTLLNNGLVNGDRVQYTQGGTSLTGLTNGSFYYVVNAVESTGVFQVSATVGGAAIAWTETATGTYTFTKDSTAYCKLFAREYQKTYAAANLTDIGVTLMKYIVYRFPLANSSDSIKVTAQGTGGDYNKVLITYLRDAANSFALYNVRGTIAGSTLYALSDVVMGSNNRWYKCILSYTSAGSPVQPASDATHWSAYEGERSFDGGLTYYPYTVIIDADNTVAATASGANTTVKIYERIQYQLRQTTDIDDNSNGAITGKVADSLLRFVGDTLVTSRGVYIESINSNDTNSIEFYDASTVSGVSRTYPYTASGSFAFNSFLTGDASSIYRLYYKQLQGSKNFGTANAVLVKNGAGSPVDLAGDISAQPSIGWTFAYDGNAQTEASWQPTTTYVAGDEYKNGTTWYRVTTGYTSGGTFGATDTSNAAALPTSTDGPSVVAVAIGLSSGQYVSTNANIRRATGQSITLTAAQERNYQNT